ncbi:MAG: anaerobic ribonucleoside-triphosphate reductase activating protein [Clostridia bacterium]|nr:anaerobic ribonucleoside-triphosphate reductase activating protein [Clostridia bacterium]MCI9274960.1 anaerobic ribonucleoside-triphosphate reductase activating protein [Clostridia bacterium]
MHYATIKKCDVANGPGVRVSLFVSGCSHHCKGCFNQEAWDYNYGNEFTNKEEDEIMEALKPDYIKGLSLLGGEPLDIKNQEGLLPVVKKAKELYPDKPIWCYTGYLFDKQVMENMAKTNDTTNELLKYIDYVVDGQFVESLRNPSLQFRGSSNQRIIDVQKTLENHEVTLWDKIEE